MTKAAIAVGVAALLLSGCSSVQIDPQRPIATTVAPFNAQLGFNRVSVPEGSRLVPATIDGKTAYCTDQPAWFAILEARSVCFTDDSRSGYLDKYYVLGTLKSLTYDSHIPYTIDPGAIATSARPAVSEADVAECAYEAEAATHADRGILMPAINAANLRNLCLRAKAARRAEGLK